MRLNRKVRDELYAQCRYLTDSIPNRLTEGALLYQWVVSLLENAHQHPEWFEELEAHIPAEKVQPPPPLFLDDLADHKHIREEKF